MAIDNGWTREFEERRQSDLQRIDQMTEPTNHDPIDMRQMLEKSLGQNQQLKADLEYHRQREKEFEVQVNALITVRDRQKVEIAELRKEIEGLEGALEE